MNVLKKIIISILGIGFIGYILTIIVFLLADDFVYKHNIMFSKAQNFFFVILMVGLVLSIIIKRITK